ncbi:MAG TPA: N-formylglutamate amidohydrolase [Sphingomonas sp.]|nr:N-formylglutamate amidohydrolase [Sphingomonas sp.]
MSRARQEPDAFTRLGPPGAPTPLVIAVPHAGRCYPPALLAASRLPRHALETIEDRYADLLIADAVAMGAVAIVAPIARAWIDLNRAEEELDPAILAEPAASPIGAVSPKAAGGLGVIPSRIAAGGAVWRRPLAAAEIEERIARFHRPYHQAIAAAMEEARAAHGVAILIDCHSMPSIAREGPHVVIGDRHGAGAAAHFSVAAAAAAMRHGLRHARNRPYAGGYTLDRHGAPRRGRHAVQIEIDRRLYLDAALLRPGKGLEGARMLIADIAAALIAAARGGLAEAAE